MDIVRFHFWVDKESYEEIVRDSFEIQKSARNNDKKYSHHKYAKEALLFKGELDACGTTDLAKAAFENRQFEERSASNLNYNMSDFMSEALKFYSKKVLGIDQDFEAEQLLETV